MRAQVDADLLCEYGHVNIFRCYVFPASRRGIQQFIQSCQYVNKETCGFIVARAPSGFPSHPAPPWLLHHLMRPAKQQVELPVARV